MAGGNGSKLAVLIDADNTVAGVAQDLLAAVDKIGAAHVRRAYGDWTRPALKAWKSQCLAHSIEPIQQLSYIRGKNLTDMAMVIDAMDLLHTGRFDGFCLVSSDSDFTPLATRIRETGLIVCGFGKKSTPKPFVAACNTFTFLESISTPTAAKAKKTAPAPAKAARASHEQLVGDATLMSQLSTAMAKAANGDGWAPLHVVGGRIAEQVPGFSTGSFGFAKLSDLMAATAVFEVKRRSPGAGQQEVVYAREKPPARAS
jgi:uncharacterized LabA/DUF88 family protein